MNPWRHVLTEIENEIERASQQVGSYRVLPDRIQVLLPAARFRPWTAVLGDVTGEIGEALLEWAGARQALWYRAAGPNLDVRIRERSHLSVSCDFTRASGPGRGARTSRSAPTGRSIGTT